MHTILVVVQVLVAVSLIGLILVQHGKGADAGAAFGSGASGTVFGARGAANFLTRLTAILATGFFVASLSLAYLVSDRSPKTTSVIDSLGPTLVTDEAEAPAMVEEEPAERSSAGSTEADTTNASPVQSIPSEYGSESGAEGETAKNPE